MSWFKNLIVYRLTGPVSLNLAPQAFQPCTDLQVESHGWVPPVEGGDLIFTLPGGHQFAALCVEKKNLPKQAIDRLTAERCAALTKRQGFKPGRKQTKEVRETVIDELIPRAFIIRSITRVWLDPVGGWLVVDTPSNGRAEDVLKALIEAQDKLPFDSWRVTRSPLAAMTDWLAADEAPGGFTVDRDAELRAQGEGKATVRYIRHALDDIDVQRHIAVGKQCTRLGMTWADRISFVLTESLTLKSVAPLDVLKEIQDSVDDRDRATGDLSLMVGELRGLLRDLGEALG
jgi:recombination associated protein RdgC